MAKECSVKLKPRISVSEMATNLGISRSRLYQLIEQGIFPHPLYCIYTKRPLYNDYLQNHCLQIKTTGIGWNGKPIMFYRPRTKHSKTLNQNVANQHQEIIDALKTMGLNCDIKQVKDAITKLYPNGTNGREQGIIIREIYRFLQSK